MIHSLKCWLFAECLLSVAVSSVDCWLGVAKCLLSEPLQGEAASWDTSVSDNRAQIKQVLIRPLDTRDISILSQYGAMLVHLAGQLLLISFDC